MNTQSPISPLVPQGSLLEQKNKGRARVKIAVFFVLAIHGIGLLALLMQGCRRDEGAGAGGGGGGSAAPTNVVAAPTFENTNTAVVEPPPASNTSAVAPAGLVTPPGSATDYKVVKGDTLATIATHHKVTLKALVDANPGVDPVKMQIGQTIHIPAPAPAPVTTTGNNGGAPAIDLASGEKIYVVKTGDSLTKIAASQGTSIAKLRAANGLKTDAIKVGQKLKIPSGSTPPAGTNGTTPTTP